ncbi:MULTISPECIES: hypothetical protein [unclassified Amycolatopsis]|uniref:hypothetical protein n=1 Tax=unclassified Amycolatopsis TaxID=2618356 RepID=UPI001A904B17|nr:MULTISPECIES: hypothetical protein [unclassified Amycolatopsis]HET6711594.1 hypothetical protein [Amycolatopsis sp.]
MTLWDKLGMDDKLVKVLQEIPPGPDAEEFGRAYVTIHQLAVELDQRFPEVRKQLDVPLGGGATRHAGLVELLGKELVDKIRRYGDVYPIEAAQLSSVRFREVRLRGPGGRDLVGASKTDLPLIRLRPKD